MSTRFVCIGAEKAGTTWLHRVLSLHGQIWLPPIKEVHYFDEIYVWEGHYLERLRRLKLLTKEYVELLAASKGGSPSPDLAHKKERFGDLIRLLAVTTDREYALYFEVGSRGKVCAGDITPAYAALPPEGFARIRRVFPNVRALFVMRDPVDRLWSSIRHDASLRKVPPEQLALNMTRRTSFAIPARSDYKRTIESMTQGGITNSKIYLYEEFFANPRAGLADLLTCLGLDPTINAQMATAMPDQVNKGTEKAAPPEFIRIMRERLGSVYDFADAAGYPVRQYWRWQTDQQT